MNKPIENKMLQQLETMEGWCSPTKALALFHHVIEHKPTICLEIGVFGGKSLLAIAYGLREVSHGKVIGLDTWAKDDCLVDLDPTNSEWWGRIVDLKQIYLGCAKAVVESGLAAYIDIMVRSSYDAFRFTPVDSIELLHIDGNHSEWCSTSDVCLWLPQVVQGGYVFMDDVNWPSTQTAVKFVEKWCDRISTTQTEASTFSVYKKR